MVFSSTVFLFLFLPMTIIGYYALRECYGNYWLLFMSIVFFAWSQPTYLWIILASVVINYSFAMVLSIKKNKAILGFAVILNLSLLFYYKYLDFFISTGNTLLGLNVALKEIVLPIGISFFTFQGMSYVIDVYRGTVKVQKNPLKVALYIMLFPQLVAGPIVRYSDIEREIDSRGVDISDLSSGITRFIIGLGKKAIVANTMAEIVDNIWKYGAENYTIPIVWLGSIAYSLQIFYDFSGYSDMAIGIGRIFGFHFCENFDRPYISKSITEFWRRWHMSLSSWFRDYVYIPLGGNRKHLYRNLIIVFLLTGLWHGASWTFVIWGLWNAIFIVSERFARSKGKSIETANGLWNGLSHIYALLVINIGWVLFRAENISSAFTYIGAMFGIGLPAEPGFTSGWYLNRWSLFLFVIAVLDITGMIRKAIHLIKNKLPGVVYDILTLIVMYGLFVLSVMRIYSGTYNPFIYFQF